MLYHWRSKTLRQYGLGWIIAEGRTVSHARDCARAAFYRYLENEKGWYEEPDYEEAKASFEQDLAVDPVVGQAVIIEGSQ